MPDLSLDARRLKALGHPVRLGIALRLAAEPETCACDFAEVFHVSQPTVSQHLRVLREAGLVTTRRRGTQICYSLDADALAAVRGLVSGLVAA
jgi:ArsR family transcriptional regulator, arsenate/arsenite/antimonite-responsive transcriptional repressor